MMDTPLDRTADRRNSLLVGAVALAAGLVALVAALRTGTILLLPDSVDHLNIARSVVDNPQFSIRLMGSNWLPLPHLLLLPFVASRTLWQTGVAGAIPSLVSLVAAAVGIYRLALRMMPSAWALVAAMFFCLNANMLYLSTTAMTEPLCVAMTIWVVVALGAALDAIDAGDGVQVRRRLLALGVVVFAASLTRYEEWILSAVVWVVVAWRLARREQMRSLLRPFAILTALTAAAPLLWFAYNHLWWRDWLDFLRGPHSSAGIVRTRFPNHFPGWHDPWFSLKLYLRAAQVDAAAWKLGWLVSLMAFVGTLRLVRGKKNTTVLLLWLPLLFYVYCMTSGSVYIGAPKRPLWHWSDPRYAIELLPALATFSVAGLFWLQRRWNWRWMPAVALLLVLVNLGWMLRETPVEVTDARDFSGARMTLEMPLADALKRMPPGTTILMDHWGGDGLVGALERAGFPLRQTIGPRGDPRWAQAVSDPGDAVAYAVGMNQDRIVKAVQQHAEDFTEVSTFCDENQRCVHIYQSKVYKRNGTGADER